MARPSVKPLAVRAQIEQRFVDAMQPTDVLPSERSLAELFGVSRVTVRAALKLLEEDGLLRSVPGVGTFVAAPHLSKTPVLTSFSQDVRARGWTPGSRVLERRRDVADTVVAHDLGIEPGAEYYEVRRVRLADDVPLSVEQVQLPAALVPGLIERTLDGSLYQELADHYGIRISRHDRRISAVNLDAGTAALLGVPERSAALYVTQQGYDQHGRRIEHGKSIYRGDRYDFSTVTYAPGGRP